jgi:hypothetical protein
LRPQAIKPATPTSPIAPLPGAPAANSTLLGGLPDWANLLIHDRLAWEAAVRAAEHGPRVLIATSAGGSKPSTIVETLLAVALTLRGARVQVLLCDEALPACMMANIKSTAPEVLVNNEIGRYVCNTCFAPGHLSYQGLGLPIHRYGDFITPEERDWARQLAGDMPMGEIRNYQFEGLAVGEHAVAGALRYFASGNLDAEALAEPVQRRYFEAALLTTRMIKGLLSRYSFEAACFHHGIYVPQGLIGEVARQRAVRVVNWNPAYRKQCFIFSHGDTYHHTLLKEPTADWETLPWSESLEAEIMDYLKSRWQGTQDWIWFHENPREELTSIAAETGIDFDKPCIGMLTNVMWDAQLHYPANAFPDMLDWVLRTIAYFRGRPELQLVIRIHPAEIRGTLRSRQPLLAEIQRECPQLPSNVFIIPPESQISTYAVMAPCNAVIIYGTKTGVELTSMGIPVIVAGEAWIRNKGLTMDASSPENYFDLLDQLPLPARMSPEQVQKARRYAYHFFFRRSIPLEMMKQTTGWPPYELEFDRLEDLRPGKSLGLDVICDGILAGSQFIYPAELQTATSEGQL